jgi:diacylglycerol kinase (ATP)
MYKKLTHLLHRRILNTLKFSFDGLISAWKLEEAIRIEISIFPFVVFGAYLFAGTKVEGILIVSSALLIIILELINTAIEKTIDRISADQHPLSKIIKDVGSATVLLAIINFLIISGTILIS